MRRFTTLVTLLLALLWVPATVHCQLERVSDLEILSCCTHPDAEHDRNHHEQDCAHDGCAAIESGFYKPEDAKLEARPAPLSFPWLFLTQDHSPLTLPALRAAAPPAPPDRLRIWQFTQRAAPAPRAPNPA